MADRKFKPGDTVTFIPFEDISHVENSGYYRKHGFIPGKSYVVHGWSDTYSQYRVLQSDQSDWWFVREHDLIAPANLLPDDGFSLEELELGKSLLDT